MFVCCLSNILAWLVGGVLCGPNAMTGSSKPTLARAAAPTARPHLLTDTLAH